MKRIILALITSCALPFAAAATANAATPPPASPSASASPSATPSPTATPSTTPPAAQPAPAASPAVIPTDYPGYYVGSDAFAHYWWAIVAGTNQLNIQYSNPISTGPGMSVHVITISGGWQELEATNSADQGLGCWKFDKDAGGDIDLGACTGVDSELWASSYQSINSQGTLSDVLVWSKYFNENYLNFCVAPHSAVITDNYENGLAYLACPLLSGGTQFSNHQNWTFSTET